LDLYKNNKGKIQERRGKRQVKGIGGFRWWIRKNLPREKNLKKKEVGRQLVHHVREAKRNRGELKKGEGKKGAEKIAGYQNKWKAAPGRWGPSYPIPRELPWTGKDGSLKKRVRKEAQLQLGLRKEERSKEYEIEGGSFIVLGRGEKIKSKGADVGGVGKKKK